MAQSYDEKKRKLIEKIHTSQNYERNFIESWKWQNNFQLDADSVTATKR